MLLSTSTVAVTISSPFTLNRATNTSLLYLLLTIPTELTILASSCSLSNPAATCAITSNKLNITAFTDLSSLTITFKATTAYFATSSPFSATLYYSTYLVGTSSSATLSAYCSSPCQQCTATASQCLSCVPSPYTTKNTYLSFNNTCVITCPSTFYLSSSQCLACNSSACLACTGTSNNCTSCSAGKYLYSANNTCLSVCPAQYYGANTSCYNCVYPCYNCTSSSVCSSCAATYFLDTTSKCVQTCSNVSYIGINGTCQQCTSNCGTCSASLSN